ncbi:MAG: hypothetical protein IJ227_00220 [Mogibacterium sp.]|nr:hypothetical protein [Mogibacterium sp.]
MADNKEMKASTEANRQKKAERREAKAARKAANMVEEKKKRPSNLVLAIMIFGVLIGMFAFTVGYRYFSKPASIEKYMEENGMNEMYTDVPVDEHSTAKIRAEGNTLKILITVDEDADEEVLKTYQGEDGDKTLKQMGAYFLTSLKPEVRGFGGDVKVGVKQGDKTINYVKLSYKEAKEVSEEAQKEAEEAAADGAAEAADEAADAAEETEGEAEESGN